MHLMTEGTPTVVVINDDDAVRDSLKLLLKSINLPVTVYASAQEFLPSYVLDQPGCPRVLAAADAA
jgi:two-component system, LuxR family, response regulator FixJ